MTEIRASVVLATYDRKSSLTRLLEGLSRQSAARDTFEVIVVDDGSREDMTPLQGEFRAAIQLSIVRQPNSGVAVARQNGVGLARGAIVIFLDDDMIVGEDFVANHLAYHEHCENRVVMGQLMADDNIHHMPLFERFHAKALDKCALKYSTTRTFAGHSVYTGNLSLHRELFWRVGGFDPTFHVEDSELGVRLQRAGAEFVFAPDTATIHASDHASLEFWLKRSILDGRDWVRIARKHPTVPEASPWRHLFEVSVASMPFLVVATLFPTAATSLSRLVYAAACGADALGLERAAVAGTTLVYGIQYYAGVSVETGRLRDVVADCRTYLRCRKPFRGSSLGRSA